MDIKNPKDLDKIVKFCRKNGVTSLKSGDFEISFSPAALFPESEYKKKKEESSIPVQVESLYTEEDILNWSSAGIPEETN